MTRTMPNWISFTPSRKAIGVNSGPNRINAGAPSRIMPKIIITTADTTMNIVAPKRVPSSVIALDMRSGRRSMVSA